jgi:hypothetical protein
MDLSFRISGSDFNILAPPSQNVFADCKKEKRKIRNSLLASVPYHFHAILSSINALGSLKRTAIPKMDIARLLMYLHRRRRVSRNFRIREMDRSHTRSIDQIRRSSELVGVSVLSFASTHALG